jgi:hypothetical protein
MNRGSNKASVANGYHNGGNAMDVTPQANDAGEILGMSMNQYQPSQIVQFHGALILRPGNDLYISVKGPVSTAFRTLVYYYEHEIE